MFLFLDYWRSEAHNSRHADTATPGPDAHDSNEADGDTSCHCSGEETSYSYYDDFGGISGTSNDDEWWYGNTSSHGRPA